jgi:beta-lactamase class D
LLHPCIGNQEEIDQFWLNGTLKITPQEQINFLRRLHDHDLPFSERTMAIVKDIMINEQTPDYTIRAKTGWYVGYLEKGAPQSESRGDRLFFFATNIDIEKPTDAAAGIELTRRCLKELGVL